MIKKSNGVIHIDNRTAFLRQELETLVGVNIAQRATINKLTASLKAATIDLKQKRKEIKAYEERENEKTNS